ncbi:hypothetical protein ABH944_006208 [Caballeronia udeis]|uniref:Uncharacterized protein n=1 Tax=Caballeronia udeis TaxID=1232866 RepID=A0ABW8MR04_9BURK
MTEISSKTISGPMIELRPDDNVVIGCATSDIAPGTMVRGHNFQFRGFEGDDAFGADYRPVDMLPVAERATFQGKEPGAALADARRVILGSRACKLWHQTGSYGLLQLEPYVLSLCLFFLATQAWAGPVEFGLSEFIGPWPSMDSRQ